MGLQSATLACASALPAGLPSKPVLLLRERHASCSSRHTIARVPALTAMRREGRERFNRRARRIQLANGHSGLRLGEVRPPSLVGPARYHLTRHSKTRCRGSWPV